MKLVIIGGSGLIGSRLVPILRTQGYEAVPASPATGVNTLTGAGLAEVLQGASVLIPAGDARLGEVRFEAWRHQPVLR